MVERVDGSLYMNMRSRQEKKQRAYSLSKDGGQTWSAVKFDARLPEPSCQGSIIRFTREPQSDRNRILLACPANPAARDHLTIRITYDECGSWPVSKVLLRISRLFGSRCHGRRACTLLLRGRRLQENGLARFNIEWLTDGKDSPTRK